MIAITVSNATRPGAELAAAMLRESGYEVKFFQADGLGGLAMERAILDGTIRGVYDLTTSELATHRLPDRLTAAALKGIPQVISLGGLDAEQSPEVLDAIGKEIAEKASAARGPTRVLVPLKGLSIEPPTQAVLALFQSLRNWIYPPVLLMECDAAINDPDFIASVIAAFPAPAK